MCICQGISLPPDRQVTPRERPLILIGITHPQTSLVLRGRLRSLQNAGFRVVLISSPGPMLDCFAAEERVEVLAISMERGIAPLADLVSLIRLCRAIIRLHPDVAEFSTPKAGFLGSLAAFLCRVPHRVYLLRGLRLETSSGMTRRVLTATERLAAACSHVVVCNSESLRNRAISLRVANSAKLRLIGEGSSNGVDIDRFSPGSSDLRRQLRIPDGDPVIGFVGRMTRDKGVPELIEAFEHVLEVSPQAKLLLVGWYDESEDALSAEMRESIDCHPGIVRTGFVADTAPYYRAMDMLVLPTWREGFPNVVLEAAASGLPVITTLATGSRDAVVPEVTGLLIPPGHPEAISEAILNLLANPGLRKRMGTAARSWVIDHFVNARVQELSAAFYRTMLESRVQQGSRLSIKEEAATAE